MEGGVYFYLLKKTLEFNRKNIVTCNGKSILLFTRYIQTTQSSVKSIRKCKKNPYIINQCTNKNHSYKHNEQINKQNIDNSQCFGVTYVKIYPEMTSQ